ncbi:MAG: permease prefix domain 1-containing protein [Clostridia bacterium]|nr:permease prefix domain 1-containing protein [Clostridia bacterium]
MAGYIEPDAGIMKIIEKYVDELCQRMDEPPEEIADFREEMTSNLASSVREFIDGGYSPRQAVELAIERFGDPRSLQEQLEELYRVKKVFATGLLKVAIAMAVIGMILFWSFQMWENYSLAHRSLEGIVANLSQYVGSPQKPITSEMTIEAIRIVEEMATVKAIGLRVIPREKLGHTPIKKYDYLYPAKQELDKYGFLAWEGGFWFNFRDMRSTVEIPGTNQVIEVHVKQMKMDVNGIPGVGILLIFGYWILFAAWASLNAFYNGHGTPAWVLVFIVFNIVGYWMYLSITRKKKGVRA